MMNKFPINKPQNTSSADFSNFAKSSGLSTSKNNLTETFLNITDSMSREKQLSFAASIIANRVMTQGITHENEGFIRNISQKFSTNEMDTLKSEIEEIAAGNMFDKKEISNFLQSFDNLLQSPREASQFGGLQTLPQFKRTNDVFFRASMLSEGL